MTFPKIDAVVSDADKAGIKVKLDAVRTTLAPITVNLTPEDRRQFGRGGDKSRAFVLKASSLVMRNSTFLRRMFDDTGFQRRVDDSDNLNWVLRHFR